MCLWSCIGHDQRQGCEPYSCHHVESLMTHGPTKYSQHLLHNRKKAQLSIWKYSCVYFKKSWTCSESCLPLIMELQNVLSNANTTHIGPCVLTSLYVVNIGNDQFIEISKPHGLGPFYLVWVLWELNEAELLPWVMSLEDAKSLLS